MRTKVSRQTIYLLVFSTLLLVITLLFSFLVLIPEGQIYREQRTELKKETLEFENYEAFHEETLERLKKIQAQNRHIITAFRAPFNAQRFEKLNQKYFNSLVLSEQVKSANEEEFAVYEVNTTSKINSPTVFYEFLDAVNKSDWIIGVNFPINFKREGDMVRSSFTMKVYAAQKDSNSSE